MRRWQRWAALTPLALGLGPWAAAAAQTTFYAGAGFGYTAVVDGGLGNRQGSRNWFGMVGLESGGPVGGRLEGAETMSRLWLSADLTYRLSARDRQVRPYGVIGGGFVLDLSELDPLLTLGAGLRVQAGRLIFLFTEARLQWVPSMPATSGEARLVLPLIAGLGIGY
ncbi:MAG TPA: hypothetical protein VF252_02660 [Gemmatimonadales bacterium]